MRRRAGMAGKLSLAWRFALTGTEGAYVTRPPGGFSAVVCSGSPRLSDCSSMSRKPIFRYTKNSQNAGHPHIPASDRLTLLSDQDLYLFNEGSNYRMYETMGAHLVSRERAKTGAVFSVWAPNARLVSVIGSFNDWGARNQSARRLAATPASGKDSSPA